jgi:DNA-binding transcriptional LysR family regulator
MTVDRRGLSAFLHIARLGSVGAAANAMSLTQPAVSRTLRRLEQQLGVKLFVRHSTGMELTTFGQSLLPHAAALENDLKRALLEIDQLKGASKGIVRVGILASLAPEHLPRVLNSLLPKLPGIQLQIVEGPTHQLAFALLRGDIDFAVAAVSPEGTDESIIVNVLAQDDICIVGRNGHPLLGKKSVRFEDLCGYQWVLHEKGGSIWRYFQMMFAARNMELPPVVLTGNSIQTLTSIVIASNLLTMLPRICIRDEEHKKVLRPIPVREAHWQRQIAILRRSTSPMLPAAAVVMSEFRKAFLASA